MNAMRDNFFCLIGARPFFWRSGLLCYSSHFRLLKFFFRNQQSKKIFDAQCYGQNTATTAQIRQSLTKIRTNLGYLKHLDKTIAVLGKFTPLQTGLGNLTLF